MKTIILTGGGTAGHVTPNLALLPSLKEAGYDVHYIGSYNGIEKELIEQNKEDFLNIDFELLENGNIMMRDVDFGNIRLRGYGTFAIKVEDPTKFMRECFGTILISRKI